MDLIVIGVDPGRAGALAVLDAHGQPVGMFAFDRVPVEDCCASLAALVARAPAYCVAVEAVHAMPGQGVCSMFSFGRALGRVEGALAAGGLQWTTVTPQAWRRACGCSGCDKSAVVHWAQRQWPTLDLRAHERCRVAHSGIVDALAIAWWALKHGPRFHGLRPPVRRAFVPGPCREHQELRAAPAQTTTRRRAITTPMLADRAGS